MASPGSVPPKAPHTPFQLSEAWLDLTHNFCITTSKTLPSFTVLSVTFVSFLLCDGQLFSTSWSDSLNLQPGARQQPSYLLLTITLILIAWDKEDLGFMLSASRGSD